MKTHSALLIAVTLLAGGCYSPPPIVEHASVADITVIFNEPEKFTDVRESYGGATSRHDLELLSQHLKATAAQLLPPGDTLTVTFTDIDLAGEFQPDRPKRRDVRIITGSYAPRMDLNFKWENADGAVVREGTRQLTNGPFDQDPSGAGRSGQPLFHDKQLLDQWLNREFQAKPAGKTAGVLRPHPIALDFDFGSSPDYGR